MSRQLINEYRSDLDRLRAVSGSRRESVLREAFKDLLKRWGRSRDLLFIPEHDIVTPQKNRIYLDGALRVSFGYWEAKDAEDDVDAEIFNLHGIGAIIVHRGAQPLSPMRERLKNIIEANRDSWVFKNG